MEIAFAAKAAGMFAITNIDDLVLLALFFGRARGERSAIRVVLGQYVGFIAILAASVAGALGAQLLPESAIGYLGLIPLLLGLHAAWSAWRHRDVDEGGIDEPKGMGVFTVASVTFANGGDNIGVYVPVFAVSGTVGMAVYVAIFLIGVAVLCAAGWYFASRPAVAGLLSRWGHVIAPVVLICIGLVILIEGGALGL